MRFVARLQIEAGGTPKILSRRARNSPPQILYEILEGGSCSQEATHSGTFCRIFGFVVYVASLHLLLSGTLLSELPAGRAEFPEGERQQQAIGGPFPNFP